MEIEQAKKDDIAKLILRIAVGGLMIFHGVHKLIYGHEIIVKLLENAGLPSFLSYGVPIGEVIAPILLIFGVLTRPAAWLIAFTMVMSIVLYFGIAGAFLLGPHGGLKSELNLLFLVGSIAIALLGSGRYALTKGQWKYD